MRIGIKLPVFLVATLALASAHGIEADWEIEFGAEHTNNARRQDVITIDENIAALGLRADLTRDATDIQLDINSEVEFLHYTENTFDDETLVNVVGTLVWSPLPERLRWEFHDSFGQIGIDPFAPVTAENREDTNIFRTGPDLLFRIGSNEFTLGARFVDDSYEQTPVDNQRWLAGLNLTRPVSPGRTLTVDLGSERIEFDDMTVNSSFDRQSASVGFVSETSRSLFKAELGTSQIHDYEDTFSTLLSSLRYEMRRGDVAAAWVYWRTDYSDAGRSFTDRQGSDMRFSEVQDVIPLSEPFELRHLEAGADFAMPELRGNLALSWTEEDFERSTAFDRDILNLRIGLERDLSRIMTLAANLNIGNTEFGTSGAEFDDLFARISLQVSLSRQLSTKVYVSKERRNGNSVLVTDFTDNRIGLSLVYAGQ